MDDFFDVLSEKRSKHDIVKSITAIPSSYVGSKRRLLSHIVDVLEDNQVQYDSVLDAFSGSAMVSLLFKKLGKRVYSNDLLTSSAITAICLLENDSLPVTQEDIDFLCKNEPKDTGTFVLDNYKDKFFTEKECKFLDRYRRNVELMFGSKFYCGIDLINKATLASIPNSNFSVYGKDLQKLRGTHQEGRSFWDEKWRDTTRKRRDKKNEIMFEKAVNEFHDKYKAAFSLFMVENHINKNCFLGGRMFQNQTIANLEHRFQQFYKTKGSPIDEMPMSVDKFKEVLTKGESCVFNSDIIELLDSKVLEADLIYLDPPYGGHSSDYAFLYKFLEEYLYEDKIENLEHIQKGRKRFCKKKGYQEQFENLLSKCGDYKTWLISYNESSFANLDTIVSIIRNERKNVEVFDVPITYCYRKNKGMVDVNHFKENYADSGHKYTERGTEHLILVS